MRNLSLLVLLTLVLAPASVAAPGETSGNSLAPLRVTGFDRASGQLALSYQTGCAATGNTIHYGSLDQLRSYGWSGASCDVGTDGTVSGFNPGTGSYFFVIVGADGGMEGSYGRSLGAGTVAERPAHTGNGCGLTQSLVDTCGPASVGTACGSSLDCGPRLGCTLGASGGGQCGCLAPFAGTFCEVCAPGYAGPDCRSCAAGFVGNEMQAGDAGELPVDRTAPEIFRCKPDVPGDCTGRSCGGHGSCVVAGRDAVCACNPGFTGLECQDCAPNYERGATGACALGSACREAKCGGHGDCLAAAFGDVVCQCDAGYAGFDCGGPRIRIAASSETLSLYVGESIVLTPQGGTPPYTWSLLEGPGRIEDCPPRDLDPACPTNSVRVTALASGAISDGLLVMRVGVGDGAGPQTAINLAAAPSSFLPFTGAIRTELVPYYNAMQQFMRARGIRGAVLGISKGGVIVGTNGYGYRDAGLDSDPFVNAGAGEAGPLVQPQSPFRIASVTKPMTAAAVRAAAEEANVDITSASAGNRASKWVEDSLGFDLESDTPPYNYNVQGGGTDSRWSTVTIQHLLNHHIGFWRDSSLPGINNRPAYNSNLLPFTAGPQPNGMQIAVTGFSNDMSYATSHMLAGLQLTSDPRVTVENTILFAAGNRFQYSPGSAAVGQGDNYQNLGFMLAGRVLEGLKGETYDPDDPSAPEGWGAYPTLLQSYLCESSGIQTGIWPGDPFNPRAGEPYYRDIDANGNEVLDWNMAQGDKIRFNNGAQQWEFCQSNCDGQNPTWGTTANTPSTYGGIWPAQRNSSGGLVATTSALLRFARNHRVKVGAPFDGNDDGIGVPLQAPGNYESSSSHNGANAGTSSLLWQMGGNRANQLPQPVGAWNPDPSAPLNLAPNGNVIINEATFVGSNCNLPSDVAVAVMFNQRQDRRAPAVLNTPTPNNNNQPPGNSTSSVVYGRIVDFLGDATCKVNAQGWPQLAEPPAQVNFVPTCD